MVAPVTAPPDPGSAAQQTVQPAVQQELTRSRDEAVAATMANVRALCASGPVDAARLAAVKDELLALAARRQLFPAEAFPAPAPADGVGSCLYRLSQDDDERFALYLNACADRTDTPPHDHTTWAVVVGFDGEELNRFYRRIPATAAAAADASGVEETGAEVVRAGTGVTMLPTDLHSIHIRGGGLNFHLYGLALERLEGRRYFRAETATWHTFPAHRDIREARPGRATLRTE